MIRKLTLLLLLFVGLNSIAHAQVRDTVTISLPAYTDTTCPGTQLIFSAGQSSDTFSHVYFHWYTNTYYTGIVIDTFYTTAVSDGDSVYCWMYFTNSAGVFDSSRSNTIIIHRSTSIPARVLIAITTGSNPDCSGNALTFTAYPINGGTHPQDQWMVNGMELSGEDSVTISRYFGGADTVTCRMVSNSPCAPVDTVYSVQVPILHIHLTAGITISAWANPVCGNKTDTFWAHASDYGSTAMYQWYVDTTAIIGAVNDYYTSGSLHTGDSVYCILTTTDTCVLNPVTKSNAIIVTVEHVIANYAYTNLIRGVNNGCIDSPVTFKGIIDSFGTTPGFEWFINGISAGSTYDTITRTFANLDILSFKVWQTDTGCYEHDTFYTPGVILIRDSVPQTPLISLIGDELNATFAFGEYTWYKTTGFGIYTDSVLPGANLGHYHPTTLGFYYCKKDSSNCQSAPSNIIYISLLSVDGISKKNVKIYPNPSTGIVNFNWGGEMMNLKMDVYNAVGQGLLHQDIVNKTQYETDLSYLPEGMYIVVLKDEEGNMSTNRISISRN